VGEQGGLFASLHSMGQQQVVRDFISDIKKSPLYLMNIKVTDDKPITGLYCRIPAGTFLKELLFLWQAYISSDRPRRRISVV
jgi:hypothetical protein